MSAVRNANLVLRFALELFALVASAYWGFTVASGLAAWVLGLATPVLVAVAWGLLVSPKARFELAAPVRLAIEFAILGAVAVALAAAGQAALAVAFAAVALVSGIINHVTR